MAQQNPENHIIKFWGKIYHSCQMLQAWFSHSEAAQIPNA